MAVGDVAQRRHALAHRPAARNGIACGTRSRRADWPGWAGRLPAGCGGRSPRCRVPAPPTAALPCTDGAGRRYRSCAAAVSITRPRYSTITRSERYSTTARSCAMNSIASPSRRLQFRQQIDDLCLQRHVQRRDRLIGHDQRRLQRQRAGDADALALAAGELVRIAAQRIGRQPDQRATVPPRVRRGRRDLGRCRGSPAARSGSPQPSCADRAIRTGPGRSAAHGGGTVSTGVPAARSHRSRRT